MGFFSKLTAPFRADSAPSPAPGAAVPVLLGDGMTSSTCILPGGFENPNNGLGTPGLDPTALLGFRAGRLLDPITISNLYTYDWLAQRIIELMPSIALVRGIQGVPDNLLRAFEALNTTDRFPMGAFERGVFDGRGYGGAVLLCGYAKGNPTTPLTPAQAASGIEWFDLINQSELYVERRYQDPNRGDLGMPSLYRVVGSNTGGPPHPRTGQVFHASRSIRFSGLPLRVPNNTASFVGDYPEVGVSVLSPVLNEIGRYSMSWSSVSNMLQDASVAVFTMAGLVEALASEDKTLIEDRMRVMQSMKSNNRAVFLDADNNESYTRTEVKLTDVPAILQQVMVAVSGAAGVPARIFFSSSPSGLNANASGDSDLNQFYNSCRNYQRRYLGPKLDTILTAVNGGKQVHVEWPSLWEASDGEQAATRLAHANATKVYWDMGVCEASDVVKAAKTGVGPETLGTPDDNRVVLSSGEGGGDPSVPPQAAPDKTQASKITTKQRANDAIPLREALLADWVATDPAGLADVLERISK